MILEATRGDEDTAFERADGLVEGVDGAAQAAADLLHAVGEHGKAAVELLAELGNRARVLGDLLLLPAVGDRAQEGDQGRRRRDEDALVDALLQERWVDFERTVVEVLARQEQEDEVR